MIAQNNDFAFKMAAQDQVLLLQDLPDEVLIAVMSFLDLKALLSAKLVCKHFEDLADQFIYESVKILRGLQAVSLSASLTKNNVRRTWIRSLLVSTKFGEDSGLSRIPPCMEHMRNLETLRLETPDCNNRQPEERVDWIGLQDKYEAIFEQSSLLVPIPTERKLPHLRNCTLHFVDRNVELYSLTKYASIFLHPYLRSLTISCTSTDLPHRLARALKHPQDLERSTALEHLFLEECDIHAPSLAYLLSFPRGLKSFRFSEGVRYDGLFRTGSRRMHGNIKPQQLMDALSETCAESLETLALSLGYRRRQSQSINDAGQYLNMTRMTKLKFLEIDSITMHLIRPTPHCDHRTWLRLPPKLETFKIGSIKLSSQLPFDTRREPHIPLETCLIKDKAKHGVPYLKTIIYSYEFNDNDDDYNEIDDFSLLGNPARAPNFAQWFSNTIQAGNLGIHPLPNNVAGVPNAGQANNNAANLANVPIHPPQPPIANNHIPPHITNNFNAVNPGNLNAAQQMLRQHWLVQAHRAQSQSRRFSREFTHLEISKIAVLNILNNELLPQFRQYDTSLRVDMVKLPRGFIPPYLYPEEKPSVQTAWWSSDNAKETEWYKRQFRHAREMRIFERNMREERERRRREEELRELRRRIGRGDDAATQPRPLADILTEEQQQLFEAAVITATIGDDEAVGGIDQDNSGSNYSDDQDEDDFEDDEDDIDIVDDDDDDNWEEDGEDEEEESVHGDNEDLIFIPQGIVLTDQQGYGHAMDLGEDGNMSFVEGDGPQISSTHATVDDESEGDSNFVDAPAHWEDTL